MCLLKSIEQEIEKAKDKNDLMAIIQKISNALIDYPGEVPLYRLRAELWVKLDEKGKAINDYQAVLQHDPNDQDAEIRIQFLETILRYNNSDIYANTNTNMDPWFD